MADAPIEANPTAVRVTERVYSDPDPAGGRTLLASEGDQLPLGEARARGIPEDLLEAVAWARATSRDEPTGEEPGPDGEPDESWNVEQLKDALRARELPVSGKKAELLERLRDEPTGEEPGPDGEPDGSDGSSPDGDGDASSGEPTDTDPAEFPKDLGGGWFQLSDGEKVQGQDEANDAQAALDG